MIFMIPACPKNWLLAARLEKSNMKKAIEALPLLGSLRETTKVITSRYTAIRVDKYENLVLFSPPIGPQLTVQALLAAVNAIKGGMGIGIQLNQNIMELINFDTLGYLERFSGLDVHEAVRQLNSMARTFNEILSAFNPSGATDEPRINATSILKFPPNAHATIILATTLADLLSVSHLHTLGKLLEFGPDSVAEYSRKTKNLDKVGKEKRLRLLRRIASLAHADSMSMLREQSETGKTNGIIFEKPEFVQAPEFIPDTTNRSTAEEERYVRENYPRLYKLMQKQDRLSQEDKTRRKQLRKLISSLSKSGVPPHFVANCFRKGICEEPDILDIFRSAAGSSGKTSNETIRSKPAYRAERTVLAVPATAAKEANVSNGVSKEEFLSAIHFSDATREFIEKNGFSEAEIVFIMCKGFDFGKSRAALGSSHYRGTNVRNNIMRIRTKGRDQLNPDNVFGFLRKTDLLNDYSNSARTKDEALSINLHPKTRIGKDIIDSLNRAFFKHKQRKD